jgi:hypothetical protein
VNRKRVVATFQDAHHASVEGQDVGAEAASAVSSGVIDQTRREGSIRDLPPANRGRPCTPPRRGRLPH